MKRLLSIAAAAALLTATLGSCRSHTTDETYQAGNGNPETTAQQEQLSPRIDAPNNAGMADSAGNASGAGTTGSTNGGTTGTTGGGTTGSTTGTTGSMGTTGGSTTGSTGTTGSN